MREGVSGLSGWQSWPPSVRCQLPMLLLAASIPAILTACGSPGIPLPPSLQLPQSVTDLRAVRKGDKVYLAWTVPARTTDLQLIHGEVSTKICRGWGATMLDCGTPVGEVSSMPVSPTRLTQKSAKIQAAFVDTLPEALQKNNPAAEITYAVSAVNQNGRSAGLSNFAHVPGGTTPMPPVDLQADVTAAGVKLTWESVNPPPREGTRYFYRLYRHEEAQTQDAVAGELPLGDSASALIDKAIAWEKNYRYRITVVMAIDRPGENEVHLEGNDSAEINVFAHDVFPPAVPSGLQAVFSGAGQKPFIDLVWSPDMDADLAGYNVYRREEGSSAVKINPEIVKAPAFRDENVKPGKTYLYSVSAVDLRGNESTHSGETSETVP